MNALIPESILAEIRARLPINEVVGRLARLRRNGRSWRGPCPLHGSTSASLQASPDRQSFHCFGCGAHGDVFGWIMRTEGCDFRQAVLRCAGEAGVDLEGDAGERRVALPAPLPRAPRDDSKRLRFAAKVWEETAPIEEGSPVAAYLAARGLWPIPPAAHAVLRAARRRYPPDGEGADRAWPAGQGAHPVMVARVSAPGVKLTAVHCTYLAKDGGAKLALDDGHSAKLVFGPLPPGAAIRLAAPASAMGCAEGIETALAASRLFDGLAVWATISAGGMERFVPPKACDELTIFADRDKPQTKLRWRPEGEGLHVARALRDRLRAEGRAARIRVPVEPFGDYADVLKAGVAA
jgi:hypothetical protein